MRVEIRGKVYESVPAAAKALRVSPQTIYCAVSRRATDTVGLGKGNRTERRGGRPPKAVTIGPVTFRSMGEASRALGHGRRYVQQVLANGGERARANLLRKAMEYSAAQERAAIKQRMKEISDG